MKIGSNLTSGLSKIAKVSMFGLAMLPATQMLNALNKDTFQYSDNGKNSVLSSSSVKPNLELSNLVSTPKDLSAVQPKNIDLVYRPDSSKSNVQLINDVLPPLKNEKLVQETKDFSAYSATVPADLANNDALGHASKMIRVKFKDSKINNGNSLYRIDFDPQAIDENTKLFSYMYIGGQPKQVLFQTAQMSAADGEIVTKIIVKTSDSIYVRTIDVKGNSSKVNYNKYYKESGETKEATLTKDTFQQEIKKLFMTSSYDIFNELSAIENFTDK